VKLDLVKMGAPIETSWFNSRTKEKIYEERLYQVDLDYTYTTYLSNNPQINSGYGYGTAEVVMQSVQSYEILYQAIGNTHEHGVSDDIECFNVNTSSSSLIEFKTCNWEKNGVAHYVSRTLERYSFNQKDNRINIIDVCEKADRPHVLQVGSEIL
jgi:hypothetical protein